MHLLNRLFEMIDVDIEYIEVELAALLHQVRLYSLVLVNLLVDKTLYVLGQFVL